MDALDTAWGTIKALMSREAMKDNLELYGKLQEVQQAVAEVREQIAEKERRIRELEAAADITARIEYREPFIWLKASVAGGHAEGPFCPQCHGGEDKRIHVIQRVSHRGVWDCPRCKNTYHDSTYAPPRGKPGQGPTSWMGY
jgi:ribosomal protein L37AE/L43A